MRATGKQKAIAFVLLAALASTLLMGCGSTAQGSEASQPAASSSAHKSACCD